MDFTNIAQYLGQTLKAKNLRLATAESCTGGWVAEVITSVPGSSHWFDCGFVTYSDASKQEMLDIPAEQISKHGAVSEVVARLMAEGALRYSQAQVSLAITGIAGPDGGTPEKPVGTVWFAWSGLNMTTTAECVHFQGDRFAIRAAAVEFALKGVLKRIVGV